jgi:hypothetical protein
MEVSHIKDKTRDQGPVGNLQMLCMSYLFVCYHSSSLTVSNETGLSVMFIHPERVHY